MSKLETIYSPDGIPVQVARLNALDLVRTSGYRWKPDEAVAEKIVEEAIAETLASEPEAGESAEEEAAEPIDAKSADLEDIASALAGTDAAGYLNAFSVEALKTIVEERYGEKLRLNVSKEKAVDRILALEAERIASESSAQG